MALKWKQRSGPSAMNNSLIGVFESAGYSMDGNDLSRKRKLVTTEDEGNVSIAT